MKFQTTCPHCESVFLVMEEQLRAARGWVQCGVCAAAFNARTVLADESGVPLSSPIDAPPDEAPLPAVVAADAVDTPAESALPDPGGASDPVDTSPPPDVTVGVKGIDTRTGDPGLASIILFDPDAQVSEDYGPLPGFAGEPFSGDAVATPPNADIRSPASPSARASRPSVPADRDEGAWDEAEAALPAVQVSSHVSSSWRGVPNAFWAAASLLLVLGLLAQLGYFMRDTLASEIPKMRPWLESACAAVGCTLSLPRDAALIQILGSDLQAEPAGADHLRLKLTLGNRAPYAQAWPVLVLTLTDRNDQPQARRSFAPSEYLSSPALLETGIPAQSEHSLSLPLQVHKLALAGYRLEIAY